MANAPQSPLTTFALELEQQPALKVSGVRVRLGAHNLASTRAPSRQIVIYPTSGPYGAPDRERVRHSEDPVLASVDQGMVAAIWGASIDDAWDLQQRFFQALRSYTVDGGYRFAHEGCTWDETPPDTSAQGEALVIRFRLWLPIQPPSYQSTEVESVNATTAITSPITGVDEAGTTIDVP